MSIRWDSESDWKNEQDSSGTVGRNGKLKQGYSRDKPDLSSDLVGYWPLHDENATDYSGNNNHGSLNGGITTGVAGKGGLQAMSFDGNDDYLEITHGSSLDITGQISYAFWLKAPSGQSESDPFIMSKDIEQIEAHIQASTGENSMRFIPTDGVYLDTGSDTIGYDVWNHWALTYDSSGNVAKIYKNGESISFTNNGTNPVGQNLTTTTSNLKIGVRDSSISNPLEGNLQGIRIYNRILTSKEIKNLYRWGSGDYTRQSLHDGTDKGTVSRYEFTSGSVTADSWGKSTLTDNTSAGTTSDAVSGNAKRFDGTDDEYMRATNSGQFNFGAGDFTASIWIKPDVNTSANRRFLTTNSSSGRISMFVDGGTQNLRSEVQDGSNSSSINTNKIDIISGNWYQTALVWDGSANMSKLYANGRLLAWDNTTLGDISTGSDLFIGSFDSSTSGDSWDGALDDVRIYDRALEPLEIHQLYRYGTEGRDMRKQLVNH